MGSADETWEWVNLSEVHPILITVEKFVYFVMICPLATIYYCETVILKMIGIGFRNLKV